MAVRDLSQFLEDDGLEYPLQPSSFEDPARFPDGKTYRVASPSAKVGLWLTALAELGMKANTGADLAVEDIERIKLDDDDEKTLYQRVLGATYDEMLADGLKWTVLQRVGQDAYLCFAMSQDIANSALVGRGEAVARANRATRRAAKRTGGRRSSRASTAGTGSAQGRPSRTSGSSTSPNASGAAEAV